MVAVAFMRRRYFIPVLLLLIVCLAQASTVFAHPADLYSHSIDVTLATDGISVEWVINPGPMLVPTIWFEADVDQNGAVSAEEAQRWIRLRASLLSASLDQAPLPLQMDSFEFPSSRNTFQSGTERIKIVLSASLPQSVGESYELVLQNEMDASKSLFWYGVHAQNGFKFQTPIQHTGEIMLHIFGPSAQTASGTSLYTQWDSSMPSLGQQPWSSVTEIPEQGTPRLLDFVPSEENTPQKILLDLVGQKEFSLPFYIFALGISLVLGALHALTPGHGKTVVAAYLVGSRGTMWHALALGTVVTLTHTGSVFLLGLITLLASQYILPTTVIPVMEILSGLLIVGLGLYLLWQQYVYWRKSKLKGAKNPSRTFSLKPSNTGMPSGSLQIQTAYSTHAHSHTHDHGDGHVHSHEVPEAITWRSLIALGVSGGLVPCPDAIAILLVATAINRILLGLTLIVLFSLGLAVVLIVIGLLMVNSRRLFDRMRVFDRIAPVLPMVSALVVLALGIALTFGAYVRVMDELTLAGAGSWSTDEAQIVYLAGRQDQAKQFFLANVDRRANPVLLSAENENVIEFAISPDQMNVVYITQSENVENKIWLAHIESVERRVLSNCENAICSRPVWSPDGRRIVYEQTSLSGDNLTGLATLWWLDVSTGEAKPVFQEGQLPGSNPRWSPDGKWLSYVTFTEIRLYNLETGESHAVTSTIAPALDWSPDSKKVLYRDVVLRDNQFITQIFVYDLSSRTRSTINLDVNHENLYAAWSLNGDWIALVRRALSVPRSDQIWVMRADGSEARMLTDDPEVLHNNLTWSPDGKYLLYDAYQLDSTSFESHIQMIEVDSGVITDLEIEGYKAVWRLP